MLQFRVLLALLPALGVIAREACANATTTGHLTVRGEQRYSCKCYPGEKCYPKQHDWKHLNTTVGGNLQVAVHPAAPCYGSVDGVPTFDAEKCADVTANVLNQQWTTDHPIAAMWTYWTNDTCSPLAAQPEASCTGGYYGNWVVLAKTRQHIKATVDFARDHNIRLVIRNTGHDFMGRSTGFGSIILNTHSFKEVEFLKRWNGPDGYRGGAVRVGAGMQLRELYTLASQQRPPVVVVGGECPTVGIAGGYIQGGGHGPMSSFYGMAADQALQFEVLTAAGKFLTANSRENPDLFWALKGGGPSTFAVVLSVTVKTFPEVPTAAMSLSINFTHTTDLDVFWKGVSAVHDLSNHWVDNGVFVYYELMHLRFHVQPIVGPNMTASQLLEVAQPMFDALEANNVPHTSTIKEFPTFFDMYIDMFEDEAPWASAQVGGWLFSKTDIAQNSTAITQAFRTAADNDVFLIGHIVGPGNAVPVVNNAVHPTWRDAASFTISTIFTAGNAPLAVKAAGQNLITNVAGKAFREAAPNGAAYVNEGDLEEPNWQQAYWGSNYPRLYRLKQIWDPKGVFYARTTPGTEDWDIIDDGTRLCRKV